MNTKRLFKGLFKNAAFTNVIFDRCEFSDTYFGTWHEPVTFTNCEFQKCKFIRTEFSGAKILDSSFEDCKTKKIFRISDTELKNVYFSGAYDDMIFSAASTYDSGDEAIGRLHIENVDFSRAQIFSSFYCVSISKMNIHLPSNYTVFEDAKALLLEARERLNREEILRPGLQWQVKSSLAQYDMSDLSEIDVVLESSSFVEYIEFLSSIRIS